MKNTSEASSNYDNLEQMSVTELLENINTEDKTVPFAVEKAMPQIVAFMETMIPNIANGGRLFYIGAGTSGRLGILDASECPPTYGVPAGLVIGVIAGGDNAIRNPVEFAEDSEEQAWIDLLAHDINSNDVLVGIAASGTTPYVIGALQKANEKGVLTACITCNYETPIAKIARFPIEVVVGPEFVTGSTRMKSGTAQKLVLNMISTTLMIRLGHVKGNKMVDMQLSNHKLVHRGIRMIMEEINVSEAKASDLLHKYGSVRAAIDGFTNNLR
jgi:N-acetylmuramic acid 6-phosphate etherase